VMMLSLLPVILDTIKLCGAMDTAIFGVAKSDIEKIRVNTTFLIIKQLYPIFPSLYIPKNEHPKKCQNYKGDLL